MIVNLEALKKRYTGISGSFGCSFGCNGCQAKYRLIQQLLSELTDAVDLRSQLAAKERECEQRDAVIRELVARGTFFDTGEPESWDALAHKAIALVGGEKGEGK